MTRRARSEQRDHRAVADHLRWRARAGVWWCHYPAGGYRSAVEAAIFRSLGVVAGVPDLLILHRGQLYGLELKSERGRLSPAQVQTHEQLRCAGAEVAVAHGIDQALAQLEAWNLLRHDVAKAPRRAFAGTPDKPQESQL
jgi:VRR-NUC domain